MSDYEFTAKTVEEAVEEGLKQLGLTREQAEITVLDKGGAGFLRKSKAKVKIAKKLSDGQRAVNFIDELLAKMSFSATSELAEEGEKIEINLIATNSSAIIGYRGEVLDAIQGLAGAVANTGREDYRRVVVDCEGYRERREETLKALAKKVADKAVKMGRKMTLEPMNPYERRIIHAALTDNTEVKTLSEGKEPNRYIVVVPNELKPYSRDKRDFKGGFNRERNGRGFDRNERRGGFDRREKRDFGGRSGGSKKSSVTDFKGIGGYIGNSLKED